MSLLECAMLKLHDAMEASGREHGFTDERDVSITLTFQEAKALLEASGAIETLRETLATV